MLIRSEADKASEEVKKAEKTTAAPAEGNQDDPEAQGLLMFQLQSKGLYFMNLMSCEIF